MSVKVRKKGTDEWTFVAGLGRPGPAGPGGGGSGEQGPPGKSAYEIAVEDGFEGTEEEWLASLRGENGAPGEDGATFTPEVSEDGTLSWSNDKGLPNPDPVNIKGPPGEDSVGVTSFNSRTGAVTPQSGDYTADMVGFTPGETGMTATDVQGAVEELFTSVSEGKALIASAVTDKGVPTAADATFQTMHDNILAIESGGGLPDDVYTITLTSDPPEGGTVSGGGYASAGMTCNAKAEVTDGYVFDGWEESGEVVHSNPLYSFPVSANRSLAANFYIPQYVAGRDWTAATLPSSESWQSVAYGDGTFVAVANVSISKAAYSTDGGKTWTAATLPPSNYWKSVAYGDGTFVSVANNSNQAVYSTDGGKTWTAATLPSSKEPLIKTIANGG